MKTDRSSFAAGAALAAVVILSPALGRAAGFRSMARELGSAARRGGVSRIAVLPFVPADSSPSKDGWNISEKLTTQVVRSGKVQAVERSLLRQIVSEHELGRTGLLDNRLLKKLGKVFSVDGVVTGTFVTLGRDVVVNARLIEVETGLIVAATERKLQREWFDLPGLGADARSSDYLFVPAPEFTVEPPPVPTQDFIDLRDAPSEQGCAQAARRVDWIENQILDLKARYWAIQLRKGGSLSGLKVNPGSTISDPELKQQFYDRMKSWYAQERVPELSEAEVKRFVDLDGKAYALFRDCGL